MTGPDLNVLVLNTGSSSLKFGMYAASTAAVRALSAAEIEGSDSAAAWDRIAAVVAEADVPPDAIGHRIVHGGPLLRQHMLIDDQVLRQLDDAVAFAPLHAAPALVNIRAAMQYFPGTPQVACFDTNFHLNLPAVARTLAVPHEFREAGIERYGFHGLSCESVVRQLGDAVPARLIVAHLGNGASVTAIRNGESIDTSMGLTPSGGVIMSSRSGDLDPGLIIYLMRARGLDAVALKDLIDRRSGLLGISGLSGDMRVLHAAAPTHAGAELAIAMFCYAVQKEIAAMMAVLGGIDQIVFTGGIGENDPIVRAQICGGLRWAGVLLDDVLNRSGSPAIDDPTEPCRISVLPAQEERQIARHTAALAQGE